jgi:hypothetical protein
VLERQGRRDEALGEFSRVADDPAAAPAVRAAARERAAALRGAPGR